MYTSAYLFVINILPLLQRSNNLTYIKTGHVRACAYVLGHVYVCLRVYAYICATACAYTHVCVCYKLV